MHDSLAVKRLTRVALFCAINGLWLASPADAEVPRLIRYQGTAVDSQGVPLEGPYTLTFRLYDAETAGAKVWEEVQASIPVEAGAFSVLLGQVTPLDVDWTQPRWVSIQVGEDQELAPRQRITSVPLALVAERLAGPVQVAANGHVGIGTASPSWPLSVAGATAADTIIESFLTTTGVSFQMGVDTNGASLYTPQSVPLRLFTAGSVRLFIGSDGNIGIGTGGGSPLARFHSRGPTSGVSAYFDDATNSSLTISHPSPGVALIKGLGGDSLALGAGNAEHVRITPSGNVGIGTTGPPEATLDVNGSIRANNPSGNAGGIYIGETVSLAFGEVAPIAPQTVGRGLVVAVNVTDSETAIFIAPGNGMAPTIVSQTGTTWANSNAADKASIEVGSGNLALRNRLGGTKSFHIIYIGADPH
jgi:hypothetical protein